ncbi:DUF6081 family protein [Streptomyces sp. NPDC006477]|uniref:DUF6081 family protein n=1 Tax=Streptomyces sp. NPDC006477 TaxID=3364747 RepID=UPI003686DCC6
MKIRPRTAALPLLAALCATALPSAGTATASDSATPATKPYRIVWDDFRDGFDAGRENSRWTFPQAGPFITNDGVTRTSAKGLSLVSGGINPSTGEPAFTLTVPQETPQGGLPGGLDHVKWLAFTNHTSSAGYQGFDAEPGRVLSCETTMSGRTYGTAGHPFGDAVRDSEDDLRLASVGMPVLDPETSMIFDFFVSNKRVYAFYERVTDNRERLGNYAAFTYAIPVADRDPEDFHRFKISYDRSAGVVRWLLDGEEVLKVDRIGHRLNTRKNLVLDHGGEETEVRPRQLSCGMGLFSILDGARPGARDDRALVRLSPAQNRYFRPAVGAPAPQTFHDDTSAERSRIFGQGASLDMRRMLVSSLPAS